MYTKVHKSNEAEIFGHFAIANTPHKRNVVERMGHVAKQKE